MGLPAGYLFSGERKRQAEQGLGGQTSSRKEVLREAEWWTYYNRNLSGAVFKFFMFVCEISINEEIITVCPPPGATQPTVDVYFTALYWALASSRTRLLNHIQRRATVGRTPLNEWSVRRRDLYLTKHNTHNRQTSMPRVGFEPTIAAGERP